MADDEGGMSDEDSTVPCKSTKSARCRGTTNILQEHKINVLQYINTYINTEIMYISFISFCSFCSSCRVELVLQAGY
jgi:hypothetical protein